MVEITTLPEEQQLLTDGQKRSSSVVLGKVTVALPAQGLDRRDSKVALEFEPSQRPGHGCCSSHDNPAPLRVDTPDLEIDGDLWHACQMGNLRVVQEILQQCPLLVNVRNPEDGVLPLQWAALNNKIAVARYLLDHGAEVNLLGAQQPTTALHWAVSKGHLEMIKLLIQYGADIGATDHVGYMPLLIAAQHGQVAAMLYLIALGRDVDEKDNFGRTPLLWAAYRGNFEAAEVLIREGASVNTIDEGGTSVLQWAVIRGDSRIVSLLLKNRVDPTVKDGNGKTAADWSREKNTPDWYPSLLIFHGRKSLVKGSLTPWSPLYYQQDRITSKFFIGKIYPFLLISSIFLCLCYMPNWLIGFATLIGLSMFWEYGIRPLFFPGINATDAGMVFTFQLLMIPIGFIQGPLYVLPSGTSHWYIHLTWTLLAIIASYNLWLCSRADPGAIRPSLDADKRKQVILDLIQKGQFNQRKYCLTCGVKKPLRSKHCRVCDICVARFDHHCPWTGNCVGLNNHRSFYIYVFALVTGLCLHVALAISYMKSLPLQDYTPGKYCIMGDSLCRISAGAPFVFLFTVQLSLFVIWILFLLLCQTWQIAINKTTNEMSNAYRLEYFFPGSMLDTGENGEDDPMAGRVGRIRSAHDMMNPFDRGIIGNLLEFFSAKPKHDYFELHDIPSDAMSSEYKAKAIEQTV